MHSIITYVGEIKDGIGCGFVCSHSQLFCPLTLNEITPSKLNHVTKQAKRDSILFSYKSSVQAYTDGSSLFFAPCIQ